MPEPWKQLERDTAKALKGERITDRGSDFGISLPDVRIPGLERFKVDCKYRSLPFKHHGMLQDVRKKYCKLEGTIAVLVTKSRGQHGAHVTLSMDDFAEILDAARPFL